MPELVFLRRGEEVLRFALDRPRIVLGRGDRCDVVIPDPEVSRQQAAVLLSGDSATVEDLSGKGTLVGDTRAAGATDRRRRDRARAVAGHLPGARGQHRPAPETEVGHGRSAAGRWRLRAMAGGADPSPARGLRVGAPPVGEGRRSGRMPGATWCSRTASSPASTSASPAGASASWCSTTRAPTGPGSDRCDCSRPRSRCTPSCTSARRTCCSSRPLPRARMFRRPGRGWSARTRRCAC
jgi:hypothetical protein